ncbi:MAG: hypothetical protein AAGC65_03590 [Mucilaginibacter sp.]|uniref:hypothetical protein n=1 Tax=Mucilaginibacter sp. TaxID=1882438 RepID=UPI0031AB7F9C
MKLVSNKYNFLLGFCLSLIVSDCFAQGVPTDGGGLCDGNDGGPDGCPLDTWVIILVLIALAFTFFHLRKKQKSLQA